MRSWLEALADCRSSAGMKTRKLPPDPEGAEGVMAGDPGPGGPESVPPEVFERDSIDAVTGATAAGEIAISAPEGV